jgi:transketolase
MSAGLRFGAYNLANGPDDTPPEVVLVASGSEVHLALSAQEKLHREGVAARVVSFPSWKIFQEQSRQYRDEVFPPGVPIVAVEAGVSLGWVPYVGEGVSAMIGVDQYGESAPGEIVMRKFGLTVEEISRQVHEVLSRKAST